MKLENMPFNGKNKAQIEMNVTTNDNRFLLSNNKYFQYNITTRDSINNILLLKNDDF